MAQAQAEFEQMLLALTSHDNAIRKHAESVYEQTKTADPVWLLTALVEVACTSPSVPVVNMALILLRKVFLVKENNVFARIPADQQASIKQRLLHFFGGTPETALRKAAGACISALAVLLSTSNRNAWAELWPTLLQAMNSAATAVEVRCACCDVFSHVAPLLASTYFKHNLHDISSSLQVCIRDPNSALQVKAFETIGSFAGMLEDKQLIVFKGLVPTLLECVTRTSTTDVEACKDQCAQLIGMCENSTDLFSASSADLLRCMMAIASNAAVDGEARRMAVEVMINYVQVEPKKCRQVKDFIPSFFNLLFQYLLHPDIESDWATTYEESNDADGSTDFDVGSTGLDRLATAVGGKAVTAVATSTIMANIGATAWQQRAAALTTLTYIVEGCRKQFEEHLDSILRNLVFPRFTDENAYVRYCAIQCVAQCCTDFAPEFQEAYAGDVLPLLAAALKDSVPRIQALAGGSLNNFFDEIDEDEKDCEEDERTTAFLDQYYTPVTTTLLESIAASQYLFVKHEMLGAISSILQVGKARLTAFIGTMVPLFQTYLALPEGGSDQREVRNVKCKAIECTTLLACGVGKEAFAAYSHSVCLYLINVLKEGLSNDDVRLRFVLRGWTCMVECLGAECVQYMPEVMPQLLRVANLDCDVKIDDAAPGDSNVAEDDDENVRTVRVVKPGEGEQRIRMHTALIEDKSLAITILMTITDELKGHIIPWAREIQTTAMDLLDFIAYAEIRETAAQALGFLAIAIAQAAPDQLVVYTNHVIPQMFVAAQEEPETSVSGEMLKSITKVIDTAPENALQPTYVNTSAEILQKMFSEAVEGIQEVNNAKKGLDADDELEKEDLEMEEDDQNNLLCDILDVVGVLLKKYPAFTPIFHDEYLPILHQMLGPNTGIPEHRLAVATLCDFVEHGKATAVPHLAAVAQTFLGFTTSPTHDIRQSALYGLGLCVVSLATYVPQPQAESIQFVHAASTALLAHFHAPPVKGGLSATANAISSAVRIIDHFGAHAGDVVTPLVTALVPHLPAKIDKIEAKFAHDAMIRWATIPGHPAMAQPAIRSAVLRAISQSKNVSEGAAAVLATLK